jgi:prephenate dehydrogenase
VLAPLPRTGADAVALATELVEAVGARPVVLEPERHDRLVATISHLPFLAASALVQTTSDLAVEDEAVWQLAAGGFRDTSRVAASDTTMFLDILMTNRTAVTEQLDRYLDHLTVYRTLIATGAEDELRNHLAQAKAARTQWQLRRP